VSGFVVSVNGDGAPVDGALLQRMTRSLIHRGPDAFRTHVCDEAGVGHALNVVSSDASRDAAQFLLGDDLWLSGDFRLDDRETLVSALWGKAETVTADISDGALLLAAYRAFGRNCVEHLRGDFAFALWDVKKKRLLLARDHFGIKPLFYARRNGALCACSSVDALRMLPFVGDDLDDQAIAEFLASGLFMTLDASAFADISRLPPGHALEFRNGNLRRWRYWSQPVPEEIRYRNAGQYLEHFREVMQRSVSDRLSDDSVGIHLSGGMDSAVISATARNCNAHLRMRGYTVVFDHLIPDQERRFASATADHLGFPVAFLSADDFLPYARWDATPEPIHDPFYFNQRTQYRDLLGHSRVALSGHGGDELMLGSYVADLVGRVPLWRIAGDLLGCLLIHRVRPPLGVGTVWQRRRRGPTPARVPPAWIRRELVERFDLARRVGEWSADWALSKHPFRPQAYRYYTSPAWPSVLEQEDANFTGQPVEVRYPFFDLRVAEFLLGLPPLPWCVNKHLAREAMTNLVPDAVRRRRKSPLSDDILGAHLRSKSARRAAAGTVPPALGCYIDINQLPSIEQVLNSADALWLRMAPVSLGLWLEHNGFDATKSRNRIHGTHRPKQYPGGAREATLP
jgi:asparagine synthase (glutamine-hydrolysing)